MKVVLNIICWILALACCYFPFWYTHSEMDKQEIKISHILVNTEDEAKQIRQDIVDKKITFEKAAEKYSQCPSKTQKGDIGYNVKGKLIKEFEDVAYSLDERVLSEPVKTSEGWHLIKVYDIKYFSDKENFERRYY